MGFPEQRPRRLRATSGLRRLVREHRLDPADFVYPLFVVPGKERTEPVAAMPGVARRSPDLAVQEARRAFAAGVPAVILFGLPAAKDAEGSEAVSFIHLPAPETRDDILLRFLLLKKKKNYI